MFTDYFFFVIITLCVIGTFLFPYLSILIWCIYAYVFFKWKYNYGETTINTLQILEWIKGYTSKIPYSEAIIGVFTLYVSRTPSLTTSSNPTNEGDNSFVIPVLNE